MRTVQSKVWLQGMVGVIWLAGAGATAGWMLHSGGIVWPPVAFALWVTLLGMAFLLARSEEGRTFAAGRFVLTAAKYGAVSGLMMMLGTLFMEYWPVTVSMACMFAVCRGFEGKRASAYC